MCLFCLGVSVMAAVVLLKVRDSAAFLGQWRYGRHTGRRIRHDWCAREAWDRPLAQACQGSFLRGSRPYEYRHSPH